MNEKEKGYLLFKALVEENIGLLKKFVYDPHATMQNLDISEESMKLPDRVRTSLERADETSKKIEKVSTESKSLTDELPKVVKVIEESFGKNFEVSIEPFGIKFSEAIAEGNGLDTGTGTVSGTWGGLDSIRPDVDG